MSFQQLRCRDLRCGDIMLKISDGSLLSRVIALGQAAVGQLNPSVVHAGIMFDSTYIIESQASGVAANDLRVQDLSYGYLVFRCTNQNVASGAGTFAKVVFDVHKTHGTTPYTVTGAALSLVGHSGRAATGAEMDAMLDRILSGRSHPFFCSQFVVMCCQFAAEQNGMPAGSFLPMADAKVPPSKLAATLSGSGHFAEIGYLLPKER